MGNNGSIGGMISISSHHNTSIRYDFKWTIAAFCARRVWTVSYLVVVFPVVVNRTSNMSVVLVLIILLINRRSSSSENFVLNGGP
jgi:hypothetical protein